MTGRVLVLRPEPGATATMRQAAGLGLDAIGAPLFVIRPCTWLLPEALPEAVLMTSANAARHGGTALAEVRHLPLYAVGAATADAAREAGFTAIATGTGGAEEILARAKTDGIGTLLHLAGRDHRAVEVPGIGIERRIVYASDAVEALPVAAQGVWPGTIALLHSPRAAALFASFVDPASIGIAAISPAVLAAAGPGWRATAVATQPDDASLLAAAAKLCDQGR